MKYLAMAAFAVAMLVAAPAMAQSRNAAVLAPEAQAVEGGRGVSVLVPQTELSVAIQTSNVSGAMGGELIGAMIDSSVEANRTRRAAELSAPILTALAGFEGDALATETTTTALANVPWFDGHTPTFGRDVSAASKLAALDAGAENQIAFFQYSYNLAPDFSSMNVVLNLAIANKGVTGRTRPAQRLNPRNLVYGQTIMSIVALSNTTTPEENAARWAANDAALTRAAIAAGFGQVGTLIPRALQLTAEDVRNPRRAERRTVGQTTGRVLDETNGTLLYSAGLVHVQTLAD